VTKEKERGFAKFLAARRNKGVEEVVKEDKAGLGEGKEVERDGGGVWMEIWIGKDGTGIGVMEQGVEVSSPSSMGRTQIMY
jgi:hypothetical protein